MGAASSRAGTPAAWFRHTGHTGTQAHRHTHAHRECGMRIEQPASATGTSLARTLQCGEAAEHAGTCPQTAQHQPYHQIGARIPHCAGKCALKLQRVPQANCTKSRPRVYAAPISRPHSTHLGWWWCGALKAFSQSSRPQNVTPEHILCPLQSASPSVAQTENIFRGRLSHGRSVVVRKRAQAQGLARQPRAC